MPRMVKKKSGGEGRHDRLEGHGLRAMVVSTVAVEASRSACRKAWRARARSARWKTNGAHAPAVTGSLFPSLSLSCLFFLFPLQPAVLLSHPAVHHSDFLCAFSLGREGLFFFFKTVLSSWLFLAVIFFCFFLFSALVFFIRARHDMFGVFGSRCVSVHHLAHLKFFTSSYPL
ncbi:hypothetical protein BOTBODRAFT_558114 [Botryobasidium botryosum FD-172 SS1]|uniref:Uncharacterized protein n=1 Tax=Botryobasidium botryosum (strain FD-172 SS1) TaxID=930990 RepID=A0A067LZQ8_BOTB1|nr:hypothetical protein BOTBODRAFT_558114 [Botryobasidium botryosum FD-172 SS1]